MQIKNQISKIKNTYQNAKIISSLIHTPAVFKRGFIISVIFLSASLGCGGGGVYHRVYKGETLWRISRTYGIEAQDVAEINNIKDPAKIKAGDRIFIPGRKTILKVKPRTPDAKGKNITEEDRIVIDNTRFSWPVNGKVITGFGMDGDIFHSGIDIEAKMGAPVKTADEGVVVYSANDVRGYGNMIIIRHKDGFFTVYAQNEKNLAKVGKKVEKGQTIALVGDSGGVDSAHLHFEVRQGKKTRNPLFFLP